MINSVRFLHMAVIKMKPRLLANLIALGIAGILKSVKKETSFSLGQLFAKKFLNKLNYAKDMLT